MKAIQKIATLFGAAALAASLGLGRADAQTFQGHFTLPFRARWGTANLPGGDYTIFVNHTPVGMGKVEVRGEGKNATRAFAFSIIDATSPSLKASDLVCLRDGSGLVIRALEIRPLNETMYFHTPKEAQVYAQRRGGKNHTLLAQAPELIERLPVKNSGR